MKFIVDRRMWYRGQGEEQSRLLTQDGQRCCIGFVASQCGVPDEQLLDTSAIHQSIGIKDFDPKRISFKYREALPVWMSNSDTADFASSLLHEAYFVNDKRTISDEDREQRLQAIFAKNGDQIEFIN
jgi:hypothetical protein